MVKKQLHSRVVETFSSQFVFISHHLGVTELTIEPNIKIKCPECGTKTDTSVWTTLNADIDPTSSSWLNLVEPWFGEITRKRIRRGVFKSVPELITAIEEYIHHNNENPKPFVWTKKAEDIVAKVSH
jgi:hypothetical protein